MISRNYNPNHVIDVRRRWSWCMRSTFDRRFTMATTITFKFHHSMRSILLSFPFILLASCASPSVVKIGPNIYLASETSAAGMFVNMSSLKARVIGKANEYANQHGMEAEGMNIKENKPIVAGFPSVDYQFRLVRPSQGGNGAPIEQTRQAY